MANIINLINLNAKYFTKIFKNQKTTPIAEKIHNTVLSLPISYGTTEEEVSRVIEVINQFQG